MKNKWMMNIGAFLLVGSLLAGCGTTTDDEIIDEREGDAPIEEREPDTNRDNEQDQTDRDNNRDDEMEDNMERDTEEDLNDDRG